MNSFRSMLAPRRNAALLVVFVIGLTVNPIQAAPPWMQMVRFRKTEAVADKTYSLTGDKGPWMIMAATFRGPNAARDAQQLVFELRRDHSLPAYTYSKVFDYSQSFVGRGVDQRGNPKRMRHQLNDRIQEVAVLVGDYASAEDPQAQRDLKTIKSAQPASLSGSGKQTSQSFAKFREMQRKLLGNKTKNPDSAPMRLAFITANPLLPDQYFRPKGVDRFVERLNSDKRFSLLECPGNYTVRVATFSGVVAVNPKNIAAIEEQGQLSQSRLEDGAAKAHRLTVALRAKGYEAYQFHDRNSSVVTVGSFYQPPQQRPDGSILYEPAVQDAIYRFGAKRKARQPNAFGAPAAAPSIQPETLLKIPFDVHPTLIEVPKRSVAADYAHRPSALR